jgi:choice-of-anchor B domain-containing protein
MPCRSIRSFQHSLLLPLFYLLFAGDSGAHDQEIDESVDHAPAADHVPCVEGVAGEYPCMNMELVHFVPVAEFGTFSANDIWGWTDPLTGFEYALLGLRNGVAFVHIDQYGHPTYLGRLPTRTFQSSWRDIKVYSNHAYIVAEAPSHGMQVFDLTRLRDVDPAEAPVVFTSDFDYMRFRSAHNIAINEDTGYAYAVGAASCIGGLHMIDLSNPKVPDFAGCFLEDRYTHDAQCVIYHGPDADYTGREICFNSNEDTVTIADVTDKSAPVMIARAPYFGSAYTHQGWLTEDHAYFLLDDELDERRRGGATRTFVWNMADLDAPFVSGVHDGSTTSIDHNQYTLGNHVFQANYRSGIRVLRFGDLSQGEMVEVAYFDTTPGDDLPLFSGTWSVYPYFKSGYVIASDIRRGLYILSPHLENVAECSDTVDNDGDGLRDYPEDPTCISADANSESIRFDVELAIDPRLDTKPIILVQKNSIKLAILGSTTVDVQDVEFDSLLFHPGDIQPKPTRRSRWAKPLDVNNDGARDLEMSVYVPATTLVPGKASLCISGLIAGDPFETCGSATVVETWRDWYNARHNESKARDSEDKADVGSTGVKASGASISGANAQLGDPKSMKNSPDHPR